MAGDHETAEDVVQRTWLSTLENPPVRGGPVRGWLARVVRNHVLQLRRASSRRAQHEGWAARQRNSGAPSTMEIVEREAARRTVVDAVLNLHEPYRSVIVLRFYEDLPPREVARRLGIPVETVRTRQKRGLAQMREALQRRGDDEGTDWRASLWLAAGSPGSLGTPGAAASLGLLAGVAALTLLAVLALVRWFRAPMTEPAPLVRAGAETPAPVDVAVAPGANAGRRAADVSADAVGAIGTGGVALAPRTSSLRGRLVDVDGRPVPHAELWVYADLAASSLDGEPLQPWGVFRGGPAGELALDGLPSTFFVHARAPGWVAVAGLAVELDPPRAIEGIEWTLAAPRALHGRVVDGRGRPIAGVEVSARTADRRGRGQSSGIEGVTFRALLRHTTRTDATGRYALSELPAAEHRLHLAHPDFAPAEEIGVEDDGTLWRMVRGARVEVRARNAAGEPVPEVQLVLCAERGGRRRAATDATGTAVFGGIVPGTDVCLVSTARGYARALSEPFDVHLRADPIVREVVLDPARSIAGRVVDGSGAPVVGARVRGRRSLDGHAWSSVESRPLRSALELPAVRTDAKGHFSFDGVGDHEFELVVAAEQTDAAVALTCRGGDSDLELVLGESAAVRVRARVVDRVSRLALDSFAVAFLPDGASGLAPQRFVATHEEPVAGGVDITLAVAARWRIAAGAPGYAPWQSKAMDVRALARLGTIELSPARDLVVRLTDRFGAPIDDARLVCRTVEGEPVPTRIRAGYWLNSVPIGPQGTVRLERLPASKVVIDARLPHLQQVASRTLDLRGSGGETLDWTLPVDCSSPRRRIRVAVLQLEADGDATIGSTLPADPRWAHGEVAVVIRDAGGREVASWRAHAGADDCVFDKPFPFLMQGFDEEGVLTTNIFRRERFDPHVSPRAARIVTPGRAHFSAEAPLAGGSIEVSLAGRAARLALPAADDCVVRLPGRTVTDRSNTPERR